MGLSDNIKKAVIADFGVLISPLAGGLAATAPVWGGALKDAFQDAFPKWTDAGWEKWVDSLAKEKYIDTDTAALIKSVKEFPGFLKVLAHVIIPLQLMGTLASAGVEIAKLDIQYSELGKTTPHPAPVDALVQAMILDPTRSTENRGQLKRHGYSDTQIDNIILSHYARLDPTTVRDNFFRGHFTQDKVYERLRELGFTDARIKEVINTWALIPPVQDLIHMAVREAFTPDIAEKFGQYEQFPAAVAEWAGKQGLSTEWAKRYWAAHWELPSATMGFEMLHRGVIDKSTMDLLLRALDIMPYWRDKITAISYNPYTRVDVRRMHDLGVIDDAGLVRAYQDLGYDKEKAMKMAEFTVKYNNDNQRNITRETVMSSYRNDLIGRAEAGELLKSLDYNDDLVEFYLVAEDYARSREVQDLQLQTIEGEYLAGLTDNQTARTRLNKLGLRGDKIDALMDQYELKKYNYVAIPSRSDIDEQLITGVITQDQWTQVMKRHGFTPDHIQWIFKALQPQIIFKGRMPSRTDINNWYSDKLITQEQWKGYMKGLGYSDEITALYFKQF